MVVVAQSNPPAGFKQLALVEKVSKAINTDWLATDLDFQNIPTGLLVAIRLQLIVPTASVVNITTDGTIFDAINNGVAIEGLFSFPLIVSKNTTLNIQHETGTQSISVYIGED